MLQRLMVAVAVIFALGCGRDQVVTRPPPDYARLKAINTVYAYACRDLRRPPKTVDELLPVFQQAGVDNPRQQLSSTRDLQPFVIIWGLDVTGKYLGAELPMAYERSGVDGVRLLVTCAGEVRKVDAGEFASLQWPAGHEPADVDDPQASEYTNGTHRAHAFARRIAAAATCGRLGT